jgi:hypothetical protein
MNGLKVATLTGKSYVPPVRRTREQICSFFLRFAGLSVSMPYGTTLPWFEPALSCDSICPDRASRNAVYAAKRAAGDTHCLIDFSQGGILYDEGGQPYQVPQPDFEANPSQFRALVQEILSVGFVPTIAFNGDNGDNPVDGYPNALRQIPILKDVLNGLHDSVLYARFYDGVFYGSDPANIQHFGQEFTRIMRQGGAAAAHLIIEHQPGRIPVGRGKEDYDPGGRMIDYDGVFGEYECWVNGSLSKDRNGPGSVYIPEAGHRESEYEQAMGNVWEVCSRLGGDTYHRPPDQPADNDPNVQTSYLRSGSPRGPYVWGIMETGGDGPAQPGVYDWVRNNCTVADLKKVGDYFRSLNAPLVCLP